MMPNEALAAELAATMTGTNIYPEPTSEQVVVPAVVLRPGTPWIENGADGMPFGNDQERYDAIGVVSIDGLHTLHRMVHTIVDTARTAGWEFESATTPATEEHAGVVVLTSTASLIYRNCTPEETES